VVFHVFELGFHVFQMVFPRSEGDLIYFEYIQSLVGSYVKLVSYHLKLVSVQ